MNWHLVPLSELEQLLGATPSGLDEETSAGRLAEFGPNQLNDLKKKTGLQMLLHQLNDFMILVLVLAAVISGIIGDIMDTVIILIIIVIDALVGFIQEYRAERAMEALKKMTVQQARVMRGGRIRDVSSSALVPGDVILLEAGNIIPADVRFFETRKLLVDESTLTGESQHVEKYPADLSGGVYPPGERTNLGYKGTHIRQGRALAYVIATGMNTELGKIAKMIQQPEPPTPLQKRLAAFGKRLSILIVIICMIIFVAGWLRGEDILTMLLTSVSLAVAAIPEALPALVTLTLAFGAKNLVKKNVLIRKLPA